MNPAEYQAILSSLKRVMKTRKITYADLAKEIGTTEVTIKRFFTSEDAPFSRITRVCEALGIPFSQLVEMSVRQNENTYQLSMEHEEFFAKNENYLVVFKTITADIQSIGGLQKRFGISKKSVVKYVRKLESLGLVEWLPDDRIRATVRGAHNWITNGPLSKRFMRAETMKFLDNLSVNWGKENHFSTSSQRYLHPSTLTSLNAELKLLATNFRNRAAQDEFLHRKEDLVKVKWLLAVSPHDFTADHLVTELAN